MPFISLFTLLFIVIAHLFPLLLVLIVAFFLGFFAFFSCLA